ncbi:hypothetical protein FK521_29665, partial [Klebsiella pneumoniae]|nr:hypothetical protein [Klebsiella pneumoniae]
VLLRRNKTATTPNKASAVFPRRCWRRRCPTVRCAFCASPSAWRAFAERTHLTAWRTLQSDGQALLGQMGWYPRLRAIKRQRTDSTEVKASA